MTLKMTAVPVKEIDFGLGMGKNTEFHHTFYLIMKAFLFLY